MPGGMVPPAAWGARPTTSMSFRLVMVAIFSLYGILVLVNSRWQPDDGYKAVNPTERAFSDNFLSLAGGSVEDMASTGSLRKKTVPTQDGGSLGVKGDDSDDVYRRSRQRREEALLQYGNDPSAVTVYDDNAEISIWDWFLPDFNCPTLQRLGRLGVGGKWGCGLDTLKDRRGDACVMYSFGMRGNLSFEEEASRRAGCQVYVFDPTRPGLPDSLANTTLPLHFHKEALGITSGPSSTSLMVRSFHDIMRQYGHDFVDIVKMDMDGAEWRIFEHGLFTEGALPFGQLLINLHYKDVPSTFRFFQGMDKAGFRVFSRETSSEPLVGPGVVPAVEYSFINPTTFGKKDPRVSAALRALPPYQRKMSGVVYFLTQRTRLSKIKEMLTLFDKNFNARYQYPIVVFHDDLTPADQKEIRSFTTTTSLTFREIQFELPKWIDPKTVPERTVCAPLSSTLGYRHMCRFLAMQVQDLLKDYDWHMRIDDDSLFNAPIGYDVFRLMSENKKLYGFNRVMMDGPDCVAGLWDTTRKFLATLPAETKAGLTLFDLWQDGAAFYNNFEISHISLWEDPLVQAYLDYIDHDGGIYSIRWGDAPIRTIAVSLVAEEQQLHYFSDIAYQHKPFQNSVSKPLPSPSVPALEHLEKAGEFKKALIEDMTRYTEAGSYNTLLAKPSAAIYIIGSSGRVDILSKTLAALEKHFNGRFDYPVWVFAHDLDYEQRLTLRSAVNTTSLLIRDAPFPLDLAHLTDPSCPYKAEGPVSWYRSFEIPARLSKRYEWLWQLSDDMVLSQDVEEDPFRIIRENNILYAPLSTNPLPKGGISHSCTTDLADQAKAVLRSNSWPEDRIRAKVDEALTSAYYAGTCDISNRRLWTSPLYQGLGARLQDQITASVGTEGGWLPAVVQTLGAAMVLEAGQARPLKGIRFANQPATVRASQPLKLPGGVTLKLVRDSAAHDLFRPQPVGFLSGDITMALPSTSQVTGVAGPDTLWLFGSTTMGTGFAKATTTQHQQQPSWTVRNAAAVSDLGAFLVAEDEEDNHVDVFWREGVDGSPQALLQFTNRPGEALLPLSGLWVQPDGASAPELLLLCRRYHSIFKPHDPVGHLGSSVVKITNAASPPRRWRVQARDLPGTNATHSWHSAMVLEDGSYLSRDPSRDKVVIMGEVLEGDGTGPCHGLARLTVQELLAVASGQRTSDVAWESSGGGGGQHSQCLFEGEPLQASRLGLLHHPKHKLWLVGDVDQQREMLVLRVATSLQGPWTTVPALDLSSLYRMGYTCDRALPVPWASPRVGDQSALALVCYEQSPTLSLRQLPVALEFVRVHFLGQQAMEISPQ